MPPTTPFDAAGPIVSFDAAILLVLHDEATEVYTEDVRFRMGPAFPGVDEATVLEALRALKVAGLVEERKSPVTLTPRWRLADGVLARATVAGLAVLATRATAGEG